MEKRVVFFDVDGTLVSPHQQVRPRVKEAIQTLRANGHLAFICTGRNLCMLERDLIDIEFDGIICSAGSYIEMNHKIIDETFIKHEKVLEIMKVFEENDILYTLEGTNSTFAADELVALFANSTEEVYDNSELERLHKEIEENMNRKSLETFYAHPTPIHKISFIAQNYENLEIPKRVLEKDFAFVIHDIFSKHSVNGEIIDRYTTKGTAVDKILDELHLKRENTIAFGDSMNDYEMFQSVAYSVAMVDGCKELQSIASAVCPSVKEDGVYHALKKKGLI